MKHITFNQLQLRILILLFILFTSAVFGYRYFVELPKLQQSMVKLSERELDILTSSISSLLNNLSRTNYDYAVWTSSYDFIRTADKEYIEENYVENTFTSLKIDGVVYLDEHLNLIYVKGFHNTKLNDLTFSFYDFERYPNNLKILPIPTITNGVPNKQGFLSTIYGPAMYSTTQIRDSDMRGENRGFLIMVHLLEQPFIDDISKYTLTNITFQANKVGEKIKNSHDWKEQSNINKVKPYSDIALNDENGEIVSTLRLEHTNSFMPKLVNEQSAVFIVLMSIFIYIVYFLVSSFIVVPIKRLAKDLKSQHESDGFSPLKESHMVKELATVSKNVNQLMATVQKQNDALAIQVITDSLTGIMNKRGLMEAIERYCNLCIREKIGFAVVMADIDYFKNYNDSEGHLEGDLALYEVANVINDQCKRSSDICARYGGEEFSLLFSNMSDVDLNEKLDDVMMAVKKLYLKHPTSPINEYITISMGCAVVKPSDVLNFKLSVNTILKVADQALYKAKNNGRNQFVVNSLSGKNLSESS